MPFSLKEWKNTPSTETPINAEALQDLEKRVVVGIIHPEDAAGNIAIGSTLPALTSGAGNVAYGAGALASLTTSPRNVAIGTEALHAETTGEGGGNISGAGDNTAVGGYALSHNTGEHNTALGAHAMENNTTSRENTAVGAYSMRAFVLTSEGGNVAVGTGSLEFAKEPSSAVAIGQGAGSHLEDTEQIAIGKNAAFGLEKGGQTIVIGAHAMESAEGSCADNICIGAKAMSTANAATLNVVIGPYAVTAGTFTGSYNCVIGAEALDSASSAEQNVVMGYRACKATTTGSSNVAIGFKAGAANETGSSNVLLGNEAGATLKTTSNALYIANSNTANPLIKGVFPNVSLQFNATEMGFYKHALAAQPKTTGTITGFTEVGGTAVKSESTFTGNLGSTKYTIGDVVLALKQMGLMAE